MYYVSPHPHCAMAEVVKSLACHQGGLASILDQYMCTVYKVALRQVFF
jgi:hypothetical protein